METTVLQRQDGSAFPEATADPESIGWDESTGTALWAVGGDAGRGTDPAVRETTEGGWVVREFEVPAQCRLQHGESGMQEAQDVDETAPMSVPDGSTEGATEASGLDAPTGTRSR